MNPHVPSLVAFFETQMVLNAKAPAERRELVRVAIDTTLANAYSIVIAHMRSSIDRPTLWKYMNAMDKEALISTVLAEWEAGLEE